MVFLVKIMRKSALAICLFGIIGFFIPCPAAAQTTARSANLSGVRSLNELFPGLSEAQKKQVFSQSGYIHSLEKNEKLDLLPISSSGIDLVSIVMKSKPSFLAESLLVAPYSGRALNKLDAYNALGRIRELKGLLYHSHTKNANIPLFEEATRLGSERRNNPIPDPPPAKELPLSETVYIRLKDTNFGNTYYCAELSTSPYGVTYNLTNNRTITYLIFPVLREGKFSAILYIEPLQEGMLVYSVAGADASDFISNRIDIPSAISKRLAVFIGWVTDGIKAIK